MMRPSLITRLDQNHPHEDAELAYEYLSKYLNKYFEKIYMSVTHPYAMVLGVELILQNGVLSTHRMFDTLTGQRGESAMESYCIEATHYADMTVIGNGRHPHKPFWRLEGDAMRRWSPSRRVPFTFHEAYWMAFLGRYAYTGSHVVETLVFEVLDEYRKRIDVDTCRVDPMQVFSQVIFEALVGKSLAQDTKMAVDSITAGHVKAVLERIGR